MKCDRRVARKADGLEIVKRCELHKRAPQLLTVLVKVYRGDLGEPAGVRALAEWPHFDVWCQSDPTAETTSPLS